MEILRMLPNEIKWNVLKYLQHPTAKIMRDYINLHEEDEDIEDDESDNESDDTNLSNYCDCCAELWDDCNCWCSNCHFLLKDCRYTCYDRE